MKKIIETLQGKKFEIPPIWLMRQAGRYLPEYREVRSNYDDFMQFCFDSKAIQKVTLQPIDRFDFDAAIIFSDILVIPHILGQSVRFEKNHGPVLSDVNWEHLFDQSNTINMPEVMRPVTEGIRATRQELSDDKALFGFAGSPWTIATYMVSRGKTQDFAQIEPFIKSNPDVFASIINVLTKKVTQWLQLQIDAGCDVVQIFDSWAGMVPEKYYESILIKPLLSIVKALQQSHAQIPIIYFGKGISNYYPTLAKQVSNIAFGIDQHTDVNFINLNLPSHIAVQGNLDPISLKNGTFDSDVKKLKNVFKDRPYVFNLGHGILPDTPIEHVERLMQLIKS